MTHDEIDHPAEYSRQGVWLEADAVRRSIRLSTSQLTIFITESAPFQSATAPLQAYQAVMMTVSPRPHDAR